MNANTKSWIIEIQKDPYTGELFFPIPTEALAQLGWDEETDIWWTVEDGNVILKDNSDESGET